MTIREVIQKLEKQVEHINITIDYLRTFNDTETKQKDIIATAKKVQKGHWTKNPEVRSKISATMKKVWRNKRKLANEHARRNNG